MPPKHVHRTKRVSATTAANQFEAEIRKSKSNTTAAATTIIATSTSTFQESEQASSSLFVLPSEKASVAPTFITLHPPPKRPPSPTTTKDAIATTNDAIDTSVDIDFSEAVFLAESDLFFDDEEDKDYQDAVTLHEKKAIATSTFRTFRPLLYLLKVLGRWPLSSTADLNGSHEFKWNWMSLGCLYYIFVTLLVTYTLLVGSWSMLGIVLDIKLGPGIIKPDKNNSNNNTAKKIPFDYEKLILHRHLPTFVMLWTSLIHCVIASATLISRRKFMAFYFTFWTKAMPTMHMDATNGMFSFMLGMVLSYVASILTLVILSVSHVGASVASAPTLFGILMFREYLEPLYNLKATQVSFATTSTTTEITTTIITSTLAPNETYNITTATPKPPPNPIYRYELLETSPSAATLINIQGGIFLLVVFSASKAYMLVFIYKCKFLKNAFAQWNSRVYANLKGPKNKKLPNHENRTTFTLLFRDHCLLLDLIDGTDQLFATILESYFALQVCSICFEAYFFIRTARYGHGLNFSYGKPFFIRPYDWLPAIIVFVQSITMLVMVAQSAAEVGEEACAGFEVLRRRTLMGRTTNDELYFMVTMFASYTAYRKIELSAGGYFYLNKEFLIGIMSTVLSYFIIIYQFQPPLDYKYTTLEANSTKFFNRKVLGQFLAKIEGSRQQYFNTEAP